MGDLPEFLRIEMELPDGKIMRYVSTNWPGYIRVACSEAGALDDPKMAWEALETRLVSAMQERDEAERMKYVRKAQRLENRTQTREVRGK